MEDFAIRNAAVPVTRVAATSFILEVVLLVCLVMHRFVLEFAMEEVFVVLFAVRFCCCYLE